MGDSLTRRQFLGTAAAGGALLAGKLGARPLMAGEGEGWPALPPVKIYRVYISGGGSWPKPSFDAPAAIAMFEKHLAEVERELGDIKFVGGEVVKSGAEAAKVAANLGDAAGVLVIHVSLGTWGQALAPIVKTGRPTAVFFQPFSGHEWVDALQWQKAGEKVLLLATSDYDEIARVVALMRVPARLRQTRIVLVGRADGTPPARSAEQVKEHLGADVVPVSVGRLTEAHKAVDPKAAETEADEWIRQAKKVVEPSTAEIVKSSRMYLAMKKIMAEERAQAISIHCLGGIPIATLGYPCLGFSKLDDLGLVGACQADMDCTLTSLIFAYAFGAPGFIANALFDTGKNAVLYAHCTAPTKMDGTAGERAPYTIRSHLEDNKGASLDVEMRVGQAVTCAKLVNLDTMLISTGKITEIPDIDDSGCRTAITVEVADVRKLMDNWLNVAKGRNYCVTVHRVVFYGDHLQSIKDLGALMGLKVAEEV